MLMIMEKVYQIGPESHRHCTTYMFVLHNSLLCKLSTAHIFVPSGFVLTLKTPMADKTWPCVGGTFALYSLLCRFIGINPGLKGKPTADDLSLLRYSTSRGQYARQVLGHLTPKHLVTLILHALL